MTTPTTETIQLLPIDNERIDRILSTRIPGGSEARDWFLPHDTERGLENVRTVVRLMIEAEREANANICRKQAELRGATEDHKYMADKCAMEIMNRSNWNTRTLSPETIAAVIEHLEKEGWKVVPKEETQLMRAHGSNALFNGNGSLANAYRAMLSAAPAYTPRSKVRGEKGEA